jgi:hypothetical protein
MVSLLDIVPVTKMVPVNGQNVEVRGLGLKDIAYLIVNHPEVKKLFNGGGDTTFSIDDVLLKAPGVAYDIIVCGTGNVGSERAREIVEALPVDSQFDLIKAIVEETFRSAGGPGPFVAKVASLLSAESVAGIMASASSSPKQPRR